MYTSRLRDFVGGWFVGDFEPTLLKCAQVEVCVKRLPKGSTEPVHYQQSATEYTLVVSGRCRIGSLTLVQDDILTIPPGQAAGFEALTDVTLVIVKAPSLPNDKIIGGMA